MKPVCVEDYRTLARRRLPRILYEYVDGAALSESAKTRNNADFSDIHLRQRVLTGVEQVSLKTEVLGTELSMPVILAPGDYDSWLDPATDIHDLKAMLKPYNRPSCRPTQSAARSTV